MIDNRLKLHELLCEILGSRYVYFQPPESTKMKYPAIVYSLLQINNRSANNAVYMQSYGYKITVIDTNPDSEIVQKISKLSKCRYDTGYMKDNLHHEVFTLFY